VVRKTGGKKKKKQARRPSRINSADVARALSPTSLKSIIKDETRRAIKSRIMVCDGELSDKASHDPGTERKETRENFDPCRQLADDFPSLSFAQISINRARADYFSTHRSIRHKRGKKGNGGEKESEREIKIII
jgi:hypothetical protein